METKILRRGYLKSYGLHSVGLFECFYKGIIQTKESDRNKIPTDVDTKNWKRRYFVLQEGFGGDGGGRDGGGRDGGGGKIHLVYYKDDKCKRVVGEIDLESCEEVSSELTSPIYQFMFSVKTRHKGELRTYYLAASSTEEMNSWVNDLCRGLGLFENPIAPEELAQLEAVPPARPEPRVELPPSRYITQHPKTEPLPSVPSSAQTRDDYFPLGECTSGDHTGLRLGDYQGDDDNERLTSIPEYVAPPPPMKGQRSQEANTYDRPPAKPDRQTENVYKVPPQRDAVSRVDTDSVYKVPPSGSLLRRLQEGEVGTRADSTYDVPPPKRCSDSLPRDSTYDVPPSALSRVPDHDSTYDVPPTHRATSQRNSASSQGSRGSGSGRTDDSGYGGKLVETDTYDAPSALNTAVPQLPTPHAQFAKATYVNLSGSEESLPKQAVKPSVQQPPVRKLSDAQKMQYVPPAATEMPKIHSYVNTPNAQVPVNNAAPSRGYLPMDGKTQPAYLPMEGKSMVDSYVPPSKDDYMCEQRYVPPDQDGEMDDIYDSQPSNKPLGSPEYNNLIADSGERDSVYQVPPSGSHPIWNTLNSTIPAPHPSITSRKHPTHDILSVNTADNSLETRVPVATPASPAEVSIYSTHPANTKTQGSYRQGVADRPVASTRTKSFRRDVPSPNVQKRTKDVLLPMRAAPSSDDSSSDEDESLSSNSPKHPVAPERPPRQAPTLMSSPPPPGKPHVPRHEGDLQYLDLDLSQSHSDDGAAERSPVFTTRSPGGPRSINQTATEYREIDFERTNALTETKKAIEKERRKSSERSIDD